jgi:hypothetical protein
MEITIIMVMDEKEWIALTQRSALFVKVLISVQWKLPKKVVMNQSDVGVWMQYFLLPC